MIKIITVITALSFSTATFAKEDPKPTPTNYNYVNIDTPKVNVENTLRSDIRNNNETNTIIKNDNTIKNDQKQGQAQVTENSNNSTLIAQGDEAQRRNPVSTAYSTPLTSSNDTCMGSTSAGAQGIGFGISLGSTWTDKNCVRLKNSRDLFNMGYHEAAVQMLCENAEVRKAMKLTGTPCK